MKVWQWLGYLGLLPFVVCLWLFNTPIEGVRGSLLFDPKQTFIFYSVIILSFIAGTLWRKDNIKGESGPQIFSNLFCLYAFSCLFFPLFFALIFLPLGYFSLFLTEYILFNNKGNGYTKPYFTMRLRLTTLVILLHGCALTLWF
jgi:hypothetical protein